MKHAKWSIAALISVALAATFVSCAQPPKAEVEAAQAAIARAESDADVPVYAADSLARAKDTYARMQKELDAKKYDAAKSLAQETVQAADKAISDAKSNKERIKSSAATTLSAVKSAIPETEGALASARKTRGVKLDFAAAGSDLENIKRSVAAAEADFNGGSFKTALEKAEGAQSRLRDLNSRIAEAVRAVSRKK
jgi:hypothetical protein